MSQGRRGRDEGSIYKRRSDGRWVASFVHGYAPDGRRKRRVLYAKTRAEVAERLRDAQEKAKRGQLPDPGRTTVAEWFEHWLEDVRTAHKHATHSAYETSYRLHIAPTLAGRPLAGLRSDHIAAMVRALQAKKLSPQRIRDVMRTLRTALRAAMATSPPLLVADPTRSVSLPRVKRAEFDMPDPSKVERLRALAREAGSPIDGFVALAFGAGLRYGEIAGLAWRHLDFSAGEVRIDRNAVETKGGIVFDDPKSEASARTIPLPRFVTDSLLTHRSAFGNVRRHDHLDRLVFPSSRTDGPIARSLFHRQYWQPVRKGAGLPALPGALAGDRGRPPRRNVPSCARGRRRGGRRPLPCRPPRLHRDRGVAPGGALRAQGRCRYRTRSSAGS